MKNLTDYNDFKNKKTVTESVDEVELVKEQTEEQVNEGAQLFDSTWKVRTRVEIPTSLLNAYIKKVKDESGEDVRKRWSEQELAEEITKYVTTSYLTIENLPTTIVSNATSEPKTQVQEEMPSETQVQSPVQSEAPVNVQIEPSEAPAPAQGAQQVAQTVPQAQKPVQSQKPAQGAQEI